MLSNISWGLFILYTGGALFIYYFVLLVLKGLGLLVKNKATGGLPPISAGLKRFWSPKVAGEEKKEQGNDHSAPLLQSAVHDLVDEIQALFASCEKDILKEQLFPKLEGVFSKYPTIKNSRYREGIINLVTLTAMNECKMQLSDEEVVQLWR